jgi:serine/threonine protein kinase
MSFQGFIDLPNARRLQFKEAEAVQLRSLLPSLPQSLGNDYVSDIVEELLAYPPLRRLRASEALQLPFFTKGELYLPPEITSSTTSDPRGNKGVGEWITRFLT